MEKLKCRLLVNVASRFVILFFLSDHLYAQKIDREALVHRHNVVITNADPLSSLTVGNGKFAFTVDVTGLQSFPEEYERGVPLGTEAEWGWHSFIDTLGFKREEALKSYHLNGKEITYSVQWNTPERNKAASNWFRQNPHRLQLGNIGFEMIRKDGSLAALDDIRNIHQELDLWTGEIKTHFTLEGIEVSVSTFAHGEEDGISCKVNSLLISEGRLKIRFQFPFPTGEWTDPGTNWGKDDKHITAILNNGTHGAQIMHELDSTLYFLWLGWNKSGSLSKNKEHCFFLTPQPGQDSFSFTVRFMPSRPSKSEWVMQSPGNYDKTRQSSIHAWSNYWSKGAMVDFSDTKDPRAFELERRIVLSQYLLRAQEAGNYPPQETGLTYNSWFGKPHLEMHWWHEAHYALWGRKELLEKSLGWYLKVADKAKAIAKRQGFEGSRWQKMTDNKGDESPSSVGAFLIWQEPHFIYFAELCYRDGHDRQILNHYKDLVFATADFMASFPYYDKGKDQYILGKGLIPAQERFKAEETFNPTFELVYWHWALETAQQWRERLHLGRNKKWDEVLKKLSPLPVQQGKYLFAQSAEDSYSNPQFRTDHPAVLGALGMMPFTGQQDTSVMKNTFEWIWKNWTWPDTWGWDFPLTAMTATRLGKPSTAIDALLMNMKTNTYLVNGHNYQDDRLRIYLPGNGGLLSAVALMCAGWDGSHQLNPGFPREWKVRWEGLRKMP